MSSSHKLTEFTEIKASLQRRYRQSAPAVLSTEKFTLDSNGFTYHILSKIADELHPDDSKWQVGGFDDSREQICKPLLKSNRKQPTNHGNGD